MLLSSGQYFLFVLTMYFSYATCSYHTNRETKSSDSLLSDNHHNFQVDSSIYSVGNSLGDPTDDEIELGFTLKPFAEWGYYIAKSKSIRAICFGGSNTVVTEYVQLLNDYLKANYSERSYAINAGISGEGAGSALRNLKMLETYGRDAMPNLVLLEFALNAPSSFVAAQEMDILIQEVKQVYLNMNKHPPYFLVIELLTVLFAANEFNGDSEHENRLHHLSSATGDIGDQDPVFNRGAKISVYSMIVPRFYGYPYLSMMDAAYPAFTRYYLSDDERVRELKSGEDRYWKYIRNDGTHMTLTGSKFLTYKLILPFLFKTIAQVTERYQIDSRHDSKHSGNFSSGHYGTHGSKGGDHEHVRNHVNGVFDEDIRLLPRQMYQDKVLVTWSSWGALSSLRPIATAEPEKSWVFTSTKFLDPSDTTHTCFGSTQENGRAIFDIKLPDSCKKPTKQSPYYCSMFVDYIHSWNITHFGDANCKVIAPSGESSESVHISGHTYQGHHVFATIPQSVLIPTTPGFLAADAGNYKLECVAQAANRVSCISSVVIKQFQN